MGQTLTTAPIVSAKKFVILHGPQGCGKTRFADRIAKHLGCDKIVDDWNGVIDQKHGNCLYITTDGSRSLAAARQLQVFEIVSFAEVAQQINAAIPRTQWFNHFEKPSKCGRYEIEVSKTSRIQPKAGPNMKFVSTSHCWTFNDSIVFLEQGDKWRGLSEEPLPV